MSNYYIVPNDTYITWSFGDGTSRQFDSEGSEYRLEMTDTGLLNVLEQHHDYRTEGVYDVTADIYNAASFISVTTQVRSWCSRSSWCHGVMESWRHGVMASWRHGVMASWCHGVMVPWCHGVMVSWCHGVMVSWRHGVMVSWCHGVMVSWCHVFRERFYV